LDAKRASALHHYNELSHVRARVSADEIKARMLGMAAGQETLLIYTFRQIISVFTEVNNYLLDIA
jgi:hypothetical protein